MATAAIGLGISGISALAGLFANRKKQTEQTETSNESIDRLQAPEYDPKTSVMKDTLMNYYLDRLGDNSNFFQGYQQQGLRNINQGSDVANENINNFLASRGLGRTSAGATAMIGNQINRGNQIASFNSSIPLLQDQRFGNLLSGANDFFSKLPVAQRITGTTTGTKKTIGTTAGNQLGGAFGGLANSLFGLYGAGAFGKSGGNVIKAGQTGDESGVLT